VTRRSAPRRAARGTTRHTEAAAAALLAWLQDQPARAPRETPSVAAAPIACAPDRAAGRTDAASEPDPPPHTSAPPADDPALGDPSALPRAVADAPLRLAHTDWLHHHLTVSGPAAPVAALQAGAAGAGVIPWQLDLDQIEEDLFLRLASPLPPQPRRLSVVGARILAGQLRDAVAHRHAVAVARVGHSRACPFDLHVLLPVPAPLLRRGPDDPAALAWLWTHWGTTDALRHVTAIDPGFADDPALITDEVAFRVSFFSADWSPWRALAALGAQWPTLRFVLRPHYAAA